MLYFLLGLFVSSTLFLLFFVLKFYNLNLLKKEKVSDNIKKDTVENIDKNVFFK